MASAVERTYIVRSGDCASSGVKGKSPAQGSVAKSPAEAESYSKIK